MKKGKFNQKFSMGDNNIGVCEWVDSEDGYYNEAIDARKGMECLVIDDYQPTQVAESKLVFVIVPSLDVGFSVIESFIDYIDYID